ncbi:MAG: Gfo/Idh/MocA family oxidoreductase [Anaerolineales bacterium]|jgi:predicted dehydrogenase|nr:MAG: Gfo/Idh/MocA family oxidoreductase [Anaerolineales bacterium]
MGLKAAVIGVGMMGRNHARVYAQMEGTSLVAAADPDASVLEPLARTYRARVYTDYVQLLDEEKPDLVSIAVPTRLHREVAVAAMSRGLHVFLEKPIAASVEEGQKIVECAHREGVKLGVGHIERFNPAVTELKKQLNAGQLGRIFQIHARRVGPFPSRVGDVGVVIDLATHELNLLEYLTGSRVKSVYAETEREIHAKHEDLLTGILKFEDGTIGILDINWLTPTKIRELSLIGEKGMFLVNYLTQDLFFYENDFRNGNWEGLAIMGVSEGQRIRHNIKRKEPLLAELESFVEAIEDDAEPQIGGEEALRAVLLAERLIESGEQHQVVWV